MKCTKRKNIFMVLAVTVFILGISVGYAANWTQNLTWNRGEVITFTVAEATTINIADPESDYNEVFHIHNTGNVAIRVSSTVTFGTGSATVTWDPSSGYVDIPIGGDGTLSLTLSDFSFGAGSATITFTSIKQP